MAQSPLYYLCGPMSGVEQFNIPLFESTAKRLREEGYNVITPFEINSLQHRRGVTETDAERLDYLRNDIRALIECQGIILLPGWEASKGAQLEHRIACALKMEIRFIAIDGGRLL